MNLYKNMCTAVISLLQYICGNNNIGSFIVLL